MMCHVAHETQKPLHSVVTKHVADATYFLFESGISRADYSVIGVDGQNRSITELDELTDILTIIVHRQRHSENLEKYEWCLQKESQRKPVSEYVCNITSPNLTQP